MGQVVTSAEMRRVVDANLKGYIEQATGSYARLFGKSPTFVTYYARDPLTSMADVNLGGAIQLIGPESPIKYQIIHDFPIYGVSEADASSAYEELQGVVSNNVRGEAYVLPGTIAPNENDFFIIDYLDARILFRAVNVNPDRIEGKSFYKLEYILDPSDPMQLGRQTNASFTFELATVGTGANPLIETDVAVLLREMEVLEEYHREAYWRAFYDRGSGALLLRSGFPGPVHDRSVDMFVRRNSLLGGQGYMKSRTVQPPQYADRGMFDDGVYPQTMYWAAEKGGVRADSPPLGCVMLAPATPPSPASPFFAEFAVSGYTEALPAPTGTAIGGTGFVDKTMAGDYDDGRPLRTLARRCLRSDGFPTDQREALRLFNAALNDSFLLEDRPDQFWLMPIVLMRAKRFRDAARANN